MGGVCGHPAATSLPSACAIATFFLYRMHKCMVRPAGLPVMPEKVEIGRVWPILSFIPYLYFYAADFALGGSPPHSFPQGNVMLHHIL